MALAFGSNMTGFHLGMDKVATIIVIGVIAAIAWKVYDLISY